MFRDLFKRNKLDTSPIDKQIAAVLSEMDMIGAGSDEYKEMLKRLERLYKLKTQQRRKPVSLDKVLIVAGNVVCLIIIVSYEHSHVITSRAIDRVRPMKED